MCTTNTQNTEQGDGPPSLGDLHTLDQMPRKPFLQTWPLMWMTTCLQAQSELDSVFPWNFISWGTPAGLHQEGCGSCCNKGNFLLFYKMPQLKWPLIVLAACTRAPLSFLSQSVNRSVVQIFKKCLAVHKSWGKPNPAPVDLVCVFLTLAQWAQCLQSSPVPFRGVINGWHFTSGKPQL